MSENNEVQDDGAVEYGSSETLDDIGQRLETQTPTDFSKITLDGDDVPEDFRGKSVSEAIQQAARFKEALRVSEDARIALKNSQEALETTRRGPAPPAPAAPTPEPELNEEQLQALFEENPRKYHDYVAQQSERRIMRQLQGAIAPVVGNSADMAIRDARNRYPDEYAAFGSDIENFISTQIPDKAALAAPGAVDQMMNYLRGMHYKKFGEYLANKNNGGLEDARSALGSQTPNGFERTPQPPRGNGKNKGPIQLDDTMKDIARALGVSEEDYARSLTPRDLRMIRSYGNR